ncbi:unnamed protein product [Symbiodinium natans]|uniref:Uncharacterized protein n=1 Tax=Symbiodinium natans TaxID=878477 RepID=A0A812TZ84_9DINO|nr:unnamed protein product [Symbiodinium natans]
MGDIPRPLTTVHLSERAAHAPHNLGESRILEISENAQANADVCPGLASALGADQAYDEIDELMPMYAQTVFADVCATSARKLLEQVLAGADPPRLVEKVKALASRPFDAATADTTEARDLTSRLKALVNFSPALT